MNLEQLRIDVAEQLGEPVEELDVDDNLLDRGLDSIRLMTLVEKWGEDGIDVSFLELADDPTVAGWHQLLAKKAAVR